jgi:hypothetical protein
MDEPGADGGHVRTPDAHRHAARQRHPNVHGSTVSGPEPHPESHRALLFAQPTAARDAGRCLPSRNVHVNPLPRRVFARTVHKAREGPPMTMTPDFRVAVEDFAEETGLGHRTPTRSGYIVNALGRDFRVTDEMARIFLNQVERVAATDASALVVLRHRDGVELLLVTDDNSFSIRTAA